MIYPHTTLTLPPTLPARKLLVSDSMDVMKSFFREYEQWFIVSIAMLHFWCKGAAPLLALLFESLYSGFSGGRRASFLL